MRNNSSLNNNDNSSCTVLQYIMLLSILRRRLPRSFAMATSAPFFKSTRGVDAARHMHGSFANSFPGSRSGEVPTSTLLLDEDIDERFVKVRGWLRSVPSIPTIFLHPVEHVQVYNVQIPVHSSRIYCVRDEFHLQNTRAVCRKISTSRVLFVLVSM